MPDARFVEGLRLFNEAEFFECHEVIEGLWLATPSDDPYRDLYKGVIQSAAAIYQAERGIWSGAEGLYRTACGYLEKYKPSALGLDVARLAEDLKNFFSPILKGERPDFSNWTSADFMKVNYDFSDAAPRGDAHA